jgi:hypothetical protein
LGANLVTAYPVRGGGRFRAYERLRPQASFATIVEDILAADKQFLTYDVDETLHLITAEGEHAAWVRLAGRHRGREARRFIGAVFLGDFSTALDCVALVPERFAELERSSLELIRGATFSMTSRPRAFHYEPPPGWHALPSGLVASWYPLDYPRNATTIVVPPAAPFDGDEAQAVQVAIAHAGAGITVDALERGEVVSRIGVRGALLTISGRRATKVLHRELAVFLVVPRVYRMRLETAAAGQLGELRLLFRTMAASFRPLPSSYEGRMQPFAIADHWAR